MGDKRAIPHLLAIFRDSKKERPEIALDLAFLRAQQAAPAIRSRLKRLLDSKKLGLLEVRAIGQYIRALATLKDKSALPLFERTLKLTSRTLRVVGIYALADLADPRGIPLVRSFLRSSDAMLRAAAASTLGALRSREDAQLLVSLLKDKDLTVRGTAIVAIGDLSSATLWPHVEPFLRNDQSLLRFCAAYAAIRLGHADLGYGLLEKGARSKNSVQRAQSLSIASKLKNRRAIPMLIRALADRENHIRALALRMLQRISGLHLGPSPGAWNRWWSANRSRYPG